MSLLATTLFALAATDWPYHCPASETVQDVAKNLSLPNAVIVVTGADGKSGSAVVLAAAMAQANVVLVGRNFDKLNATLTATAAAVPGSKPKLSIEVFDLASLNATRAGAKRLLAAHPKIDALVNNAGGVIDGVTEDGFNAMFQVQNIAPALLTDVLLPALAAAGAGARVVNVASAASFAPLPLRGHAADDMWKYAHGAPALEGDLGYALAPAPS